jgi:hypothetical protein
MCTEEASARIRAFAEKSAMRTFPSCAGWILPLAGARPTLTLDC